MKHSSSWLSIRLLAALLIFLGACGGPVSSAPEDASAAWRTTEGAVIAARIRTAYQSNHQLNALKIQVETEGRHVTLRGVVPTLIQKELAGEIALRADGVRSVKNELRVAHRRQPDVPVIRSLIQARFQSGGTRAGPA